MQKVRKTLGMLLLVFAMLIALPMAAEAEGLNGLHGAADGNWYYYVDGEVDTDFTGIIGNEFGWWYIRNGMLDTSFVGLVTNEFGTWFVANGTIDTNCNGLVFDGGSWWFVQGGMVNYGYNGLVGNEFGWWYVQNGTIDFTFSGLITNEFGTWFIQGGALNTGYNGLVFDGVDWWYVYGGAVSTGFTGLVGNDAGWWYVQNGKVDFSYTGLVGNEFGWFYVENGGINYNYTGLVQNEFGWWYVQGGSINFSYTGMAFTGSEWWYVEGGAVHPTYKGLASNDGGIWYYQNGKLDFSYSGTVVIDGVRYTVENGRVTGTMNLTCNLPESSEFYKYEYAYKTGDMSVLSEADMAFYNGFKAYLDYAYRYTTLYEQEKAIHNYMLLNCEYDYENYSNDTIPWASYWEEGVIVNKMAVCNGYAYAFKLFMDVLGIECEVITSWELNHAWNVIQLEGEWYMVDVTWDDPVPDEEGRIYFRQFNVPDEIFRQSHSIYTSDVECNGTKYSADKVFYLNTDDDLSDVNNYLVQHYLDYDKTNVVKLYVKKADGSIWSKDDYYDYYYALNDMDVMVLYSREYYPAEGTYTMMFVIQGKGINKKEECINQSWTQAQILEKARQMCESMSMQDVGLLRLEITDGSTYASINEFYQSDFYAMCSDALHTYLTYSVVYLNETNILFQCQRRYEKYTEYNMTMGESIYEFDQNTFLQRLSDAQLDSYVLLFINGNALEGKAVTDFRENCVPKNYASVCDSIRYLDGTAMICLHKYADMPEDEWKYHDTCNLRPFHPHHRYEHAYKTGDVSALTAEELQIFNGLKQYLDYAYLFGTDYEREKAIHDYMILNCTKGSSKDSGNAFTNVFVNREGSIYNYKDSFQLCMDVLGIDCISVEATANAVRIGNQWYLVQVYGDDDEYVDMTNRNVVSYGRFNIPLSAIGWDNNDAGVELNHYYITAAVQVTSAEDVEGMANLMKNWYSKELSDMSFLRVEVTKADQSAWTSSEVSGFTSRVGFTDFGSGYALTYKVLDDTKLYITCDGETIPPTVWHLSSDADVKAVESQLLHQHGTIDDVGGWTIYLTKADGTDWADKAEAMGALTVLSGIYMNSYYSDWIYLDGNTAAIYYHPQASRVIEYSVATLDTADSFDVSALVAACKAANLDYGDSVVLRIGSLAGGAWNVTEIYALRELIDASEYFYCGYYYLIYEDGSMAIRCTYHGTAE